MPAKFLLGKDRSSRRTGMDAIEVLRQEAGFTDDDRAVIHVGFIRLPSNERVGLIVVRFDQKSQEAVSCVSLPACTHFTAISDDLPVARRRVVAQLDGAEMDARGRVRLCDGTQLRALKVEPKFLPTAPSELDWRIVHLTLEVVDAKECYRSLRENFSPQERHLIPDLYFLDVERLAGLRLPPLKEITGFIAARYKKVSGQQVANALRKFGIRRPQARPC